MVVYYLTDFESVTPEHIEHMLAKMPQQQQDLVQSMKTLQRQREQAVAYAMLSLALLDKDRNISVPGIALRHIQASELHFDDHSFVFPLWDVHEHGKPFLTNYDSIEFNISHCRETIVTAISANPVGVDVEGRRKFSDTLLQRAFSDEEQALVRNSDEPELEFARIWTRKEAYFKLTGTGILLDHLKSVEEEAQDAGCSIVTQWIETGDDNGFWLSVTQSDI